MFVSTVNGTFFTPENPSIARQKDSPELTAAWDDLNHMRTHVITKQDVIKMGKDPETVARFDNDYWGLGDDAYMAQMDVFHKLHCLDLLRKAAYADFHSLTLTPLEMEQRSTHLGHCMDILYQDLTCNANTELFTLVWMEGQKYPYPGFNIHRQCKDMNVLTQWRNEHAVDTSEDKWKNMRRPASAQQIPAPDEYYRLFGEVKGGHTHQH